MKILIIEDNPADVRLFREALKSSGIIAEVSHLPDGVVALATLGTSGEPWTPPPDVVFLDLNMACVTGFDVLETLRDTPKSATVPVVVFTSSQSPQDRENALRLKADRFLRKPSDLREFFNVVSTTISELTS